MQVVPKGAAASEPLNLGQSQSQQDARARAIEKLMGGSPANEQPVPNASQVSPEEFGALQRQAKSVQQDTSENNESQDESTLPEAPKEEVKAKEDPLSSQYATLARKEKALRNQIQQFKSEQAKFKAEMEAAKAQPQQPSFDASKYIERERFKSDPLAVMAETGLDYNEVTEAILNQSQTRQDPRMKAHIDRLEAQTRALEEKLQGFEKNALDSQQQSYNQALNQIRTEAKSLVYTDPSFEMIKETKSINDVVELIEKTFKQDGILMTVEEACQAVEEHLLDEALKITKVKKLQQRIAQAAKSHSEQQGQQKQQGNQQPQQAKTLTNAVGTQRPLTARERAILAMEGKLK